MDEGRNVSYDPLAALIQKFEDVDASTTKADPFESTTLEEALQKHIVDGIRQGLEDRLEQARQIHEPLHIINEILLRGMKTVGELFGAGKMQLPFVLRSAEVMKVAVAHLEPYMERVEGSERGSMLIATVAGDVHDIGKNLVDIIMTNNGYRVVNIGIKQPIANILEQAEATKCQVIGMSGLLVKSTLVMRDNLIEMNARGLSHYPVVLGGAALTRAYVEEDLRAIYEGPLYYAADAFEGLELMDTIAKSAGQKPEPAKAKRASSHRVDESDASLYVFDGVRSEVDRLIPVPQPPFWGARTSVEPTIADITPYINKVALYRGQWQFKRPSDVSNPDFTAWLHNEADPIFERMCAELEGVIQPAVTWGYFKAKSEGNTLHIYSGEEELLGSFTFPRQSVRKRLCLADYFRAMDEPGFDTVAFHLVTVGQAISDHERELFKKGDYTDYLYVHGFGVECAEALAEYWHAKIREELDIHHDDPKGMKQIFAARYQGSRFSFGYPACPKLDDQKLLMDILLPEQIGVTISEEFMLEPEQSTSAIICHHPQAKYFKTE